MTIPRIGQVDQIYGGNNKTSPASKPVKGDSVSISSEALKKADELHINEIVAAVPDVRLERIAELKEKINDPAYINEAILRGAAENVIDSLFPDSGETVRI
jgi:negative regulator of flagellin synthesis FlgM